MFVEDDSPNGWLLKPTNNRLLVFDQNVLNVASSLSHKARYTTIDVPTTRMNNFTAANVTNLMHRNIYWYSTNTQRMVNLVVLNVLHVFAHFGLLSDLMDTNRGGTLMSKMLKIAKAIYLYLRVTGVYRTK
jgi:hypothetical protein